MRYAPDFFERSDLESAKNIILTGGRGLTTADRWEVETRWTLERISFDEGLVIDYGCGVGRLAKEIENPVLGVDISTTMRREAVEYVGRSDFGVVSPIMFEQMVKSRLKVSGIVSAWALQHVLNIEDVLATLMEALRPGGLFWLIDLGTRHVPCTDSSVGSAIWMLPLDDFQLLPAIEAFCTLESSEPLDIWPEPSPNPGKLYKYRRK